MGHADYTGAVREDSKVSPDTARERQYEQPPTDKCDSVCHGKRLQTEGIIQINVEVVCLDSTSVKVHPDGTGALKKEESRQSEDREEDSPRKFIWLPHLTERLSVFHSPAEQTTIHRKE